MASITYCETSSFLNRSVLLFLFLLPLPLSLSINLFLSPPLIGLGAHVHVQGFGGASTGGAFGGAPAAASAFSAFGAPAASASAFGATPVAIVHPSLAKYYCRSCTRQLFGSVLTCCDACRLHRVALVRLVHLPALLGGSPSRKVLQLTNGQRQQGSTVPQQAQRLKANIWRSPTCNSTAITPSRSFACRITRLAGRSWWEEEPLRVQQRDLGQLLLASVALLRQAPSVLPPVRGLKKKLKKIVTQCRARTLTFLDVYVLVCLEYVFNVSLVCL